MTELRPPRSPSLAPATPAASSRPGPSMGARIAGGTVAIAILFGVWKFDGTTRIPWIATVLTLVFGIVAAIEFAALLRLKGLVRRGALLPTLCALYLLGRAIVLERGADPGAFAEWGILLATVVVSFVELRRAEPEVGVPRAAMQLFGFVWILLFGMLLDVLLTPVAPRGIELTLFLLFTSKCNDIGGYLVGKLVGGPKLAPKVSPGKTISGSVGGVLLSLGFAFAAGRAVLPEWSVWQFCVFAVVVSGVTQLADLGESLFKRYCGAKDSSHIVPTFGGALDMIDSLVLAAPAGWALYDVFGVW
jgi:CDP-diglyceride synthetase